MKKTYLFPTLFCLLFVVGCGDPKLSGTVKFPDGSVLTAGTVVFQNEKSQGIGELKSNGTFNVYQYKPGDGLKKGVYQVYIQGAHSVNEQSGQLSPLISEKYADPKTSGITYDSSSGSTIEIVVEPPR